MLLTVLIEINVGGYSRSKEVPLDDAYLSTSQKVIRINKEELEKRREYRVFYISISVCLEVQP